MVRTSPISFSLQISSVAFIIDTALVRSPFVPVSHLVLHALHHASDLVLHLARDGRELLLHRRQLFLQDTLLLHLRGLLLASRAVHLQPMDDTFKTMTL